MKQIKINPTKILKKPGLLRDNMYSVNKSDYYFILSLLSDILQEKKTNVIIYKKKKGPDKLILSSLQYLFCGFTEKIKIEIHFDLGNKINTILLKKEEELTIFISKWRKKYQLN